MRLSTLPCRSTTRRVRGKSSASTSAAAFPVNYGGGEPYRIEHYADRLQHDCPELFDGTFGLITEFGRYVYANAAWAVSRIEYVKRTADHTTLITHAGADMFLRECYNPDDWQIRMSVMDGAGQFQTGGRIPTDVAGPLCFGGDVLARGVELPDTRSSDRVVLHDIGANTFALWSRHCSRPFPKVLGLRSVDRDFGVEIIKARESYESIVAFWS